jgi:hypothetical protein
MIGSGIFIVSADMSRLIGSPGWMLMSWVITGVLTVAAALSYGELASMMPHAGGMLDSGAPPRMESKTVTTPVKIVLASKRWSTSSKE